MYHKFREQKPNLELSPAPAFTPDPPVPDIERLLRQTECEDYKEFKDLFKIHVEDYGVVGVPEYKEAWSRFSSLIMHIETEVAREKQSNDNYSLDLEALHKAILQGPRRKINEIEVPFGSPGIATNDIHVLLFRYGFAKPTKEKGFHSWKAARAISYRTAVEILNGQPNFFFLKVSKETRETLLATRLTRHIRLTAISELSQTDEAKYKPKDNAALLTRACPEAVSPKVWDCFIALLKIIESEISAWQSVVSFEHYVWVCKQFYVGLTEPFEWKHDASVGPRLPNWPLGGPDISAPELYLMTEQFFPRNEDTLSVLGPSQTPVPDAATAYLNALIDDVGGRRDFVQSEFATIQLSKMVGKSYTGAHHLTSPPTQTPYPHTWSGGLPFQSPSTQETYQNPGLFPREGPGPQTRGGGGGPVIERGESSGTKRIREGDSPGDGQSRRGRGRGS